MIEYIKSHQKRHAQETGYEFNQRINNRNRLITMPAASPENKVA